MPDRASTWWADSTVPSASFGSSSDSSRSNPSSSEYSLRHSVRRVLGTRVQLRERPIERAPARSAGGQRDRGILALVQEAIAHESLRASDIGGARRWRGREGH